MHLYNKSEVPGTKETRRKKNWSQKLKVEISLLPMAVSNWDESIRGRSSSKCKSCSIRLASKKGRKTLMSVHLKNLPQKKKGASCVKLGVNLSYKTFTGQL